MADFDLIIRHGTVVDGTGASPRTTDLGILGGKIAAVGDLGGKAGVSEIDASGLIVAPGVIDTHTHYDAQINWDPYCTNSGWHGMTTAVIANCGFGYAPAKPEMRVRYMQMMANTEQVPFEAQAAGLSWEWETFPEWLDHLRRLPKGVNVVSYLPLNPLLCYVIGPDEAKRRPATAEERKRMRELLHEAMDHGAIGFSFSYLGVEGNSHVDFDQSPMPTDVMGEEEAFNLCDVLKERGGGAIQLLSEMPATVNPEARRAFVEELARRSGARVFHNVLIPVRDHPEFHRSGMQWLSDCQRKGLDIWSQAFVIRGWNEFNVMDMNAWDCVPVFRAMTMAGTIEARMKLVASPEYRDRLRREYDPLKMYEALGPLENHYIIDAGGAPSFAEDVGKRLDEIAIQRDALVTDVFLDLLQESEMRAEFGIHNSIAYEPEWVKELLSHPRVLAGSSDGGAHGKFWSGGQWSTDMIMQLVRESGVYKLEEVHNLLSARPAEAFHLTDRGTIETGKAADLLIYDFEKLDYTFGRYEIGRDLPGGEWRRLTPARGINYIVVNGEVTFHDAVCTGATPGSVLRATRPQDAVATPQAALQPAE